MAQSKFSNVDEYGFQRPEDFDYHTYGVFMDSYLKTLVYRRKKWETLMRTKPDWDKSKLLKRYIRKGIPSPSRGEVWMKTSQAHANMKKYPELYHKLLHNTQFDKELDPKILNDQIKNDLEEVNISNGKKCYMSFSAKKWVLSLFYKNAHISKNKKVSSIYVETIKIDLPRTFPDNIYFEEIKNDLLNVLIAYEYSINPLETIKIDLPRTFPDNIYFEEIKNDLFNVLIAYAHHNKEIGYCQGLNYIAGLILIATRNDEWTFWLLKEIVENITPSYHTKNMSGLIIDIDVLAELIKDKIPHVYNHIVKLGLPWAVIVTKWFICIFAEVLPIETVFRIWDCIFYEGNKIIFRVCLTLIKTHQDEILQSEDISQLADVFREMVQDHLVIDCHQFMKNIFSQPGKITRTQIYKLRVEINNQKKLLRKKSFSR